MSTHAGIHGTVARGFERVREVFEANFAERGELGAACCVVRRGEVVVDLWGGVRDARTGARWDADTMTTVFSTTKGVSAIALAVAASRGWLDYDERVATYWPEFAQEGKGDITVRQLLAHQAGLAAVDTTFDATTLADLDFVARGLAAQRPAWRPGEHHGYHAMTIGFYESELLRRVDPKRRSLGVFLREEITAPHGLDFHIGLPSTIGEERLARLRGFPRWHLLLHPRSLPPRFVLSMMRKRSLAARAFANPKLENAAELGKPALRAVELPASNGIGSARAIARLYGMMATGGGELGVTSKVMDELTAPATAPRHGMRDRVLHVDTLYRLGFSRSTRAFSFGPRSFGTPGAGGSFGYADPDRGIGFAYVPNRMGFWLNSDPRELALRKAVLASL